jgi:hypothetical protein
MKKILAYTIFLLLSFERFYAQIESDTTFLEEELSVTASESDFIEETFQSTRIINGHSNESLRKGVLEFRVEHRFGDIAGTDGGVQNMFGLDNSADIRLGFEYGITDRLMVGLGRNKGTGVPYRSLIDGFAKYAILKQKKKGMPISLSAVGIGTFTYQKASEDVSQISNFPKWEHRLAYAAQLIMTRKFGNVLSLALSPTLVHRNYVATSDENTLFALGGATRVALTSKMAILLEYYHVFSDDDRAYSSGAKFTNSLGVAFEWITFGHNFTVYLTNSKGFVETQFIPYTFENWLKGQFRLGFCIGRKFESEK